MRTPFFWWERPPSWTSWLLTGLLTPAELAYRMAATRGKDRVVGERMPVPVISVGNLTVGGTGKTPVVQWLANYLANSGRKPAVISRGYGGKPGDEPRIVSDGNEIFDDPDAGDEARDTARACPGVPVLTCPSRIDAVRLACERFDVQTILLDDAFQHRAIARDCDIVTVDATQPFGNGHCLPAGPLREPRAALERADMILITRAGELEPAQVEIVRGNIRRFSTTPMHTVYFNWDRVYPLTRPNETLNPAALGPVVLLSGVGNPDSFERMARDAHVNVVDHWRYGDHATYTPRVVERIGRAPSEWVLITSKDAVKLAPLMRDTGRVKVGVVTLGVPRECAWRIEQELTPFLD